MSAGTKPAVSASGPSGSLWIGRGHVSTFIRCLHLLNFDLHNDWPGIDEQTFSTRSAQQNIQQRIKAVEWSLYRLFEKFDLQETRNKLRPFFPPLTPLQSLNLRAALLRALTELKKNGVLGREIILRKTMLDECKGERFEEVLSSFAMVVLRRERSQCGSKGNTAKSPGPTVNLTDVHYLPLILAHRSLLNRNLARRVQIREHSSVLDETLKECFRNISTRRDLAVPNLNHRDSDELDQAADAVRDCWSGDPYWIQALLRGGNSPPAKQTFPLLSEHGKFTTEQDSEQTSKADSLIIDLMSRVREHQVRVQRWSEFRRSLPLLENASQNTAGTTITTPAARLRCDRHQSQASLPDGSAEFKLNPQHEDLLMRMRHQFPERHERTGYGKDHLDRRGKLKNLPPSMSTESPTSVTADDFHELGENGVTIITDSSEPAKTSALHRTSFTPQRPPGQDFELETLAERTSKSMAIAAPSSSPQTKLGSRRAKDRRSSQTYPVNQFETPHMIKNRSAIQSPTSGDSTPRDKLFEGEADYASVFKSRPRIALSPMLSPDRSTFELDSKLHSAMNELELDSGDSV